MMEKGFEVTKDGTTLNIVLGSELSIVNASALTIELSIYSRFCINYIQTDISHKCWHPMRILCLSGFRQPS